MSWTSHPDAFCQQPTAIGQPSPGLAPVLVIISIFFWRGTRHFMRSTTAGHGVESMYVHLADTKLTWWLHVLAPGGCSIPCCKSLSPKRLARRVYSIGDDLLYTRRSRTSKVPFGASIHDDRPLVSRFRVSRTTSCAVTANCCRDRRALP